MTWDQIYNITYNTVLDFYRKKKNLYKNIRGGNRSFRLPSVRLRHESVRLRPICQFAYNSYVKALKLNCWKVLVEPRRKTENQDKRFKI